MWLLEKFLILFESDASKVEEGSKKAEKATDDLNKKLKATDIVSGKIGVSLNNLIRQAMAVATGVFAVSSITAGIKSAAEYANRLHELSEAMGVNIVDLSVWSDAVKKSGGSSESFQQTIKSLTGSLSSFATKGTSLVAPFFAQLGIRMTDAHGKARDVFKILPELADKFEKLGKQQSYGIGQKLGLDEGTIMLLQRGRTAVDELIKKQRELGFVTKEDGEISAKFSNAWDDATHAMRSLFLSLNRTLLPLLTGIGEGFQKAALFFRKYSGLLEGAFFALTIAAGAFALAMVVANAAVIGVTLVIAALGAAFAIVYDDIKAFMNGSDSLIGQAIQKWPVLGEVVKFIGRVIKDTWELLKEIGVATLDQWKILIDFIKNAVSTVLSLVDKVSNAYGKVKSFLGFSSKENDVNLSLAKQSLITANAYPGAAANTTSLMNRFNNRSMSVSTGPITIQTQATDPNGISNAIGQSLSTQLRQAVNNFDDGVMI